MFEGSPLFGFRVILARHCPICGRPQRELSHCAHQLLTMRTTRQGWTCCLTERSNGWKAGLKHGTERLLTKIQNLLLPVSRFWVVSSQLKRKCGARLAGSTAHSWISLSNIAFAPGSGGWPLTLENGWVNYGCLGRAKQ